MTTMSLTTSPFQETEWDREEGDHVVGPPGNQNVFPQLRVEPRPLFLAHTQSHEPISFR